jgi:hypothetical protein
MSWETDLRSQQTAQNFMSPHITSPTHSTATTCAVANLSGPCLTKRTPVLFTTAKYDQRSAVTVSVSRAAGRRGPPHGKGECYAAVERPLNRYSLTFTCTPLRLLAVAERSPVGHCRHPAQRAAPCAPAHPCGELSISFSPFTGCAPRAP